MIVPFPAGSGTDVIGRILAKGLSDHLGTQVVVENIGGAGGMTAGSRVARAAPDGYQFMLGTTGTHALNQTLYKKPQYDAAADFAPVALLVEQPTALVVRKDLNTAPCPNSSLMPELTKPRCNSARVGSGPSPTSPVHFSMPRSA